MLPALAKSRSLFRSSNSHNGNTLLEQSSVLTRIIYIYFNLYNRYLYNIIIYMHIFVYISISIFDQQKLQNHPPVASQICELWGMNSKGFIARTMASFRPERRAPGDYGDMKGITQEPFQFCIFHENDIDKEIKVQLCYFNCPFDILWWVVWIVFLSLWICALRCAICASLTAWWLHDRRCEDEISKLQKVPMQCQAAWVS